MLRTVLELLLQGHSDLALVRDLHSDASVV